MRVYLRHATRVRSTVPLPEDETLAELVESWWEGPRRLHMSDQLRRPLLPLPRGGRREYLGGPRLRR